MFSGGKKYHFQCDPGYVPHGHTPSIVRDWKRADPDPIPDGNLDDSEYRFWVGSRTKSSEFCSCRACHVFMYTAGERIRHKQVPKGVEPCTVRLTAAYRNLLLGNKCIVCEGATYNAKWGVPLCQMKSCITRFKFEVSHWTLLDDELRKGDPEAPRIVTPTTEALVKLAETFDKINGR